MGEDCGLFCCVRGALCISQHPPAPNIQGTSREFYQLRLFQNEDTRAQGWAGSRGGTMAQLLCAGTGFSLVDSILRANPFLLRISLHVC